MVEPRSREKAEIRSNSPHQRLAARCSELDFNPNIDADINLIRENLILELSPKFKSDLSLTFEINSGIKANRNLIFEFNRKYEAHIKLIQDLKPKLKSDINLILELSPKLSPKFRSDIAPIFEPNSTPESSPAPFFSGQHRQAPFSAPGSGRTAGGEDLSDGGSGGSGAARGGFCAF